MAVPAGQDGARRLRNGMMPLRPDWNTAWHIYVQKDTSHTVFWNCTEISILMWFSSLVCTLDCGWYKGPNLPFIIRGKSGLSFTVSCSGDWQFEPFQEAQSEVAPRHWHDHRSRWNYSFPMVWPPFPGPLWGTCVSASGIWVRWSAIFIQIVARKTSIHLETKRASSWFIWEKMGISLIILSATVSRCCVSLLNDLNHYVTRNLLWYNHSTVFPVLGTFEMFFQDLSNVKVMNVGVVKTGGCICTQRAERSCSGHANHTGTSMHAD